MIQNVYGIKQFQTKLPAMARQIDEEGGHYIVTRRNKPAFVAIPFADYQDVQDILLELSSTPFMKTIVWVIRDGEIYRGNFESSMPSFKVVVVNLRVNLFN